MTQSGEEQFLYSHSDNCSYFVNFRHTQEEFKQIKNQADKARAEMLYEALKYFYLIFRWRIDWTKDSKTKFACVKILCYLVNIGLLLSGDDADSVWIERILVVLKTFPGDIYLICDVLLLTCNTKLYHEAFAVILKSILTEYLENPPDAKSYLKTILLYRRLKSISKTPSQVEVIYSLALKVKCPSEFFSWISSLEPRLFDGEQHSLAVQILLGYQKTSHIKKLYKVLFESQYPEFEVELEERKQRSFHRNFTKIKKEFQSFDLKNDLLTRNVKTEDEDVKILNLHEQGMNSGAVVAAKAENNVTFNQSNSWCLHPCNHYSGGNSYPVAGPLPCLSCRLKNTVSHSCAINMPSRMCCVTATPPVISSEPRTSAVVCLVCDNDPLSPGTCCRAQCSVDRRSTCCMTHPSNARTHPTNISMNSYPGYNSFTSTYGCPLSQGHSSSHTPAQNVIKPHRLCPESCRNYDFREQPSINSTSPSCVLQRSHSPKLRSVTSRDQHCGDAGFDKHPLPENEINCVLTSVHLPSTTTNLNIDAHSLSETSIRSVSSPCWPAPLDLSIRSVIDDFTVDSSLLAGEISKHACENAETCSTSVIENSTLLDDNLSSSKLSEGLMLNAEKNYSSPESLDLSNHCRPNRLSEANSQLSLPQTIYTASSGGSDTSIVEAPSDKNSSEVLRSGSSNDGLKSDLVNSIQKTNLSVTYQRLSKSSENISDSLSDGPSKAPVKRKVRRRKRVKSRKYVIDTDTDTTDCCAKDLGKRQKIDPEFNSKPLGIESQTKSSNQTPQNASSPKKQTEVFAKSLSDQEGVQEKLDSMPTSDALIKTSQLSSNPLPKSKLSFESKDSAVISQKGKRKNNVSKDLSDSESQKIVNDYDCESWTAELVDFSFKPPDPKTSSMEEFDLNIGPSDPAKSVSNQRNKPKMPNSPKKARSTSTVLENTKLSNSVSPEKYDSFRSDSEFHTLNSDSESSQG